MILVLQAGLVSVLIEHDFELHLYSIPAMMMSVTDTGVN